MNQSIITKAMSQVGIKEVRGKEDNPEILKYFNELGFDGSKLKDETAWCSAFMNYIAKMSGHEYTGKLTARSWLKVGQRIPLKEAILGDVVVLWRSSPHSWKGHVGIYMNHDKEKIYLLGGNQRNQVQISAYDRIRILGIRRLSIIRYY